MYMGLQVQWRKEGRLDTDLSLSILLYGHLRYGI